MCIRDSASFVPLGQLARVETVMGPPMIKSEMGSLTGWIYVDIDTSDVGGYVSAAKKLVAHEVKLPPGYFLKWTGQYELLERVRARMAWLLPLTIAIVFLILFVNFKGAAQALIVMTGVPFSAVGAIWTLWIAHFNTSIAVWVGMIALLGVAAETASVMAVSYTHLDVYKRQQRSQLDALPDLSDVQVIVATEWMGRSPTLIEDQVTYPITTTFLGAPRVKLVRGFTMFGMSFVYVIFQDGTDLYWARSRVVEYLAKIQNKLPPGVTPQIGPDATSIGWVYQYALVDESGMHNLQELRALQDWYLRYCCLLYTSRCV